MKPELTLVQNAAPQPQAPVPPPAQGEMPFAVVDGQPITEMPRDLYIPPQALEVKKKNKKIGKNNYHKNK